MINYSEKSLHNNNFIPPNGFELALNLCAIKSSFSNNDEPRIETSSTTGIRHDFHRCKLAVLARTAESCSWDDFFAL